jgi:hypothetical protein
VNGRILLLHRNPELVQGWVSESHLECTIRLQLTKFFFSSSQVVRLSRWFRVRAPHPSYTCVEREGK